MMNIKRKKIIELASYVARPVHWILDDDTGASSRAAYVLLLLRIVTSVIHVDGMIVAPMLEFLDAHAEAHEDEDFQACEGLAMRAVGAPVGGRDPHLTRWRSAPSTLDRVRREAPYLVPRYRPEAHTSLYLLPRYEPRPYT